MKIKTAELTGPALDWAVAKCEGFEAETGAFWHLTHRSGERSAYAYSTDWSQGGPIIERESISTLCVDDYEWVAGYGTTQWERGVPTSHTPLVAAMRCYVASKLGDEVDIPEELV